MKTLPARSEKYVPWDIEIARFNFRANCGPISFAVALGMEVCDAIQHFPHFPDRTWTNSTQMQHALLAAGADAKLLRRESPRQGIMLIQWLGPWTRTDFFSRWSLRYTHWVAVDSGWIFDHNYGEWLPQKNWENDFVPTCLAEIPQAAGWAAKYGFEVSKSMYSCPATSSGGGAAKSGTPCRSFST